MKKTICIDVMTALVFKVEITKITELDKISLEKNFSRNYVMVPSSNKFSS